MKEQLLQKRAVAIGYYADASRPWDTGGKGHYMSAETWAAYTYEPLGIAFFFKVFLSFVINTCNLQTPIVKAEI